MNKDIYGNSVHHIWKSAGLAEVGGFMRFTEQRKVMLISSVLDTDFFLIKDGYMQK